MILFQKFSFKNDPNTNSLKTTAELDLKTAKSAYRILGSKAPPKKITTPPAPGIKKNKSPPENSSPGEILCSLIQKFYKLKTVNLVVTHGIFTGKFTKITLLTFEKFLLK